MITNLFLSIHVYICKYIKCTSLNDRVILMSINVNASMFFNTLPMLLNGIVESVIAISAARVPLIKCIYHGYAIDIVCATVALPSPPNAAQLLHDSFLSLVSFESRGSVNGIRTVLEIQRLLPIPYEVFVCALKAIKY